MGSAILRNVFVYQCLLTVAAGRICAQSIDFSHGPASRRGGYGRHRWDGPSPSSSSSSAASIALALIVASCLAASTANEMTASPLGQFGRSCLHRCDDFSLAFLRDSRLPAVFCLLAASRNLSANGESEKGRASLRRPNAARVRNRLNRFQLLQFICDCTSSET